MLPSQTLPERCYICGSSKISLLQEVRGFLIYKCPSCALQWVINPPDHAGLEDYYGQDYYASESKEGYQDYGGDERNHRRNAGRLLRWVSSFWSLDGETILDFGCGFGFFLDEAQNLYRCQGHGVEISDAARSYAQESLHLQVGSYSSLSSAPSGFFAAAFLIGTIEHLADPRAVLEDLARVVRPGGYLFITTIDTKGLLPIYSLKPPEHLFYFNHRNLKQLLGQTGFEQVRTSTYWVNYQLHDLIHRVGKYLSSEALCTMGKFMARIAPKLSLTIPTNEIMVAAQRRGGVA